MAKAPLTPEQERENFKKYMPGATDDELDDALERLRQFITVMWEISEKSERKNRDTESKASQTEPNG